MTKDEVKRRLESAGKKLEVIKQLEAGFQPLKEKLDEVQKDEEVDI